VNPVFKAHLRAWTRDNKLILMSSSSSAYVRQMRLGEDASEAVEELTAEAGMRTDASFDYDGTIDGKNSFDRDRPISSGGSQSEVDLK
jgi:hypothetical protein